MRADIPSDRFYRQRRFGPSQFYNLRQAQRRSGLICRLSPTDPDPVARIIDPENLLKVFDLLAATGGSGAGPDGITYSDVNRTEIASALREASRLIRIGQYRPPPEREIRLAKRSGGYRVLKLGTIVHRIICKAAQLAIEGPLDAVLLPCVHGFRPKRSVLTLLADLERIAVTEDRWVIATDDIADAFPSIPIMLAVSSLARVISSQPLVGLLELLIRGHDGQSHETGLAQGCPLSPLAMNISLNFVLDSPYVGHSTNPPYWRYADNICVLAKTVAEGQEALLCARRLLQRCGPQLKGTDGPPVDLRVPGSSAKLLGLQIQRGTGELNLTVALETWDDLNTKLAEAYEYENPTRKAWEAVHGWVDARGLAFDGVENATKRIRRMLADVGIQECPSDVELGDWLRTSRDRWNSVRQAAGLRT